jgi:hypothetical protein
MRFLRTHNPKVTGSSPVPATKLKIRISTDCLRTIRFFMSLSFLLLRNVHKNVHNFPMKLNYSEPRIYTGGVDISIWSQLTNEEKKKPLSKDLFVCHHSYVSGIIFSVSELNKSCIQ